MKACPTHIAELREKLLSHRAARKPAPAQIIQVKPRLPVAQRMERIRELAAQGLTRRGLRHRGYAPALVCRAERELGFVVPTARRGRPIGTRRHDVAAIRIAMAASGNCAAVGRSFGVDRRTVYRIAVQEVRS